jgi:hypothetical protein
MLHERPAIVGKGFSVMDPLGYKPGVRDVLQRLRRLYDRSAGDQICATMEVPSAAIAQFRLRYPQPECEYPDPAERADFWDRLFRERMAIEDDSMPAAVLSEFDEGLFGGLLGGEVRFLAHGGIGWVSSMVPPLLREWSEFDRLRFDESNVWWQRYMNQLAVFVEHGRGKWGISHLIAVSGLNSVFELVGATQTYLSLDEHPEYVRRAVDLAQEVNLRIQNKFFEAATLFEGGTLSNFGQWIPGRILSDSIDPFHMTSVAYFEKWGRGPLERMIAAFDGGVIHIHGNGRHLLEAAATIRGLKGVLLMDDRGFPKAFDVLAGLKARMGDVPVAVFADYPKFAERLGRHDLPGGVIYQVVNVPDVAAANRLMEQVRAYRA